MADILNKLNSANYVTVKVTDDSITNGNNLLAAYANAKTKTPNGAALSASNRLAIILPPAIYDLGTQSLVLDTQYIDIIGSTNNKYNHFIKNNSDTGTILQTVGNIKLQNLNIENTNATGYDYYPNTNLSFTHLENIFFSGLKPTRPDIIYNGKYISCSSERDRLFGPGGTVLHGYFLDCHGKNQSFGGSSTTFNWSFIPPNNMVLSGEFIDCSAENWSFGIGCFSLGLPGSPGPGSISFQPVIYGNFINCKGDTSCFHNFDYPNTNWTVLSGTFTNCTMGGNSFRARSIYGNFTNCHAESNSFHIRKVSFQSNLSSEMKVNMTNCSAGSNSFTSSKETILVAGRITGNFTNCHAESNSFNNMENSNLYYCSALDNSFQVTSCKIINCITSGYNESAYSSSSNNYISNLTYL